MRFPRRTLRDLSLAVLGFPGLLALPAPAAREIIDCDLCIYGATSGGVVAAAQAVRHGLKVVLLDPADHVGGMSSGGLGATDKGNIESIGGLSSEFYLRVARKYAPGTATRRWLFEPKVASAVFRDLLEESAVAALLNEPLLRVNKTGPRIDSIETTTGLIVRASVFLDTTYEGDLLAAAGVSFRVGREANAEFGENRNGVLPPTRSPFGNLNIDPYLEPGHPASGLIHGISPDPPAAPGTGDALVQAYNFRLCLTQAADRLPIAPPPDYDAAEYELIGRWLVAKKSAGQAVDLASFTNGIFHNIGTADGMPGGKSDWNANKGMSSDWVGFSHDWPLASLAARQEMALAHEHYIRGIFEFLRTDPRVPVSIKNEVATWGLPADEYTENGNWSPQLYVREARRMRGNLVLTEAHGRGTVIAPQSIALASYAMDSHYCQRVVVDGKVMAEGGFFELPPRPWPIGLGAITPVPEECTNLLATFALSATHVAFSSARMEPVFMMTSHSAASAAAVSISSGLPIQEISYQELATLLRSDGQILEWAGAGTGSRLTVEAEGPGGSAQPSGQWVAGSNPGFSGTGYFHDSNSGKGNRFCTFSPNLPVAGSYRVLLSWVESSNRATNARVLINHTGGTDTLTVNQKQDPDLQAPPGGWRELGAWTFPVGSFPAVRLENAGTDGYVIADAVRFEPEGALVVPTEISMAAHDSSASEASPGDSARVVFLRSGMLENPLTIPLTYSGTAIPGTDTSLLPATIAFAAGSAQTSLTIDALPDGLAEGREELILTIPDGDGYTVGTMGPVTVFLEDQPYDQWRFSQFNESQNADPAVGGPLADPDGDGLNNYAEFILGGDPLSAGDAAPLVATAEGDNLILTMRRSDRTHPAAVEVTIETSNDLQVWQPANGVLPGEIRISGDGKHRLQDFSLPRSDQPVFFRLRL